MTRRLLLGPLAALLLAAPAQAATETLSAARAVDRDCTARLLPSGRSGVDTVRFTAPAEGTLRARLTGNARSGDWDLVAFDSAGELIQGSSAFGSNELVEVNLRKGARVTLQACRVGGRGGRVALRTAFSRFDFESLNQIGAVSLVEVPIAGLGTLKALEALGLDVTHDIEDGFAKVMLYGDRDRTLLTRTGLGFRTIVNDVVAAERLARRTDRRAARAGRSPLPSGRQEYRTYEDVQAELKQMAEQYPNLVRGFTLKTKTYEGRDIQAIEVAEDVQSEDDTRPVLFLNGIHHAREWPATEVLLEFVWDLLKNSGSDPQLASILKNVRVVMQPYTNVDGFLVSRAALGQPEDTESDAGIVYSVTTGVVLLGGSFGYKRKNCNPYPVPDIGQPCDINIGTDNNRNYPHQWGGAGASTNPNDQSYRGSGPASEPETRAVQELHLTLNAPVLLSMHNIAAKVLRPPGTEAEGFAPDEEGLKELGRRMAEPAGYVNEYGWQLYDVTGGTKDWSYAATGAFGYTVETGPDDGDFHGPYQEVVIDQYLGAGPTAGRGMREAFIAAANWTREEKYTSRLQGRAPAGRTLRITKAFKTSTSAVCTVASPLPVDTGNGGPDSCQGQGDVIEVDEKLDLVTKVPASGRFTWWLNPSTRPYAKAPEAYRVTCEDNGTVVQEVEVVVGRGQTFKLDLPCGGTLPPEEAPNKGTGTGSGSPGAGAGAGTATLKIGRVRRAGRRVRVGLTATGGVVRNVRITLLRGKRRMGSARLVSLTGARTVAIKSRRRIGRGRYVVRVSATGMRTVSKRLRVR